MKLRDLNNKLKGFLAINLQFGVSESYGLAKTPEIWSARINNRLKGDCL